MSICTVRCSQHIADLAPRVFKDNVPNGTVWGWSELRKSRVTSIRHRTNSAPKSGVLFSGISAISQHEERTPWILVKNLRSSLQVCFGFDTSVGLILSSGMRSSHTFYMERVWVWIVFLFLIRFESIYHARTSISRLNRPSINLVEVDLKWYQPNKNLRFTKTLSPWHAHQILIFD